MKLIKINCKAYGILSYSLMGKCTMAYHRLDGQEYIIEVNCLDYDYKFNIKVTDFDDDLLP